MNKTSLSIILTVNSAWNVWNFRRPVVKALLAAGHRVTILAPADDSVDKLEQMGCSFQPLEMNVKGLNPLVDLKLLWRFRRIFARDRPDVILSYTIKNNLFGALAAKSANIPFIPNVTGLGTAFLSGGGLQAIAQMLYRKAFSALSCVFFQNTDDQTLFVTRGLVTSKQAQLLPGSGIDLQEFSAAPYPSETNPPTFLMIARLLRDKGVVEFVEAAQIVKAKYPEVTFQLLGAVDAANRTAIDATTVQEWQNEGTIEFLGATDDVRPHIADAQCVVLPSYREGAPRTLIEAAAMARPLITTDVPGCRSVVDQAVTGILCEPRNANSLADACFQFLNLTTTEKIAMGSAGREKMKTEFDQALVVHAYLAAIEAVTATN